jgi:exonuclease SbcD
MKFLHAADIHLDSPLAGVARRGLVPPEVTRDCTRRAFANLIDLAIVEDVAFVIIAGDLYDADWRDFSTALFFAGEMRRLNRPCIVIRGNHDAQSVITRTLEPPPNVRVLSSRKAETFRLEQYGVAIHGQSFPNRAVPEDLSATYPAPVAGMLNIGVLHTSGEDPGEHETYAPCRIQSLVVRGYDYWALGHIHIRGVVHENPFVVFPGNIQGRHPKEIGSKGCTLVEAVDNRIVGMTHRATDVLRWGHETVDLDGAETMAEIAERVRFKLSELVATSEGRPLILRLTLGGATDVHAAMTADFESIDAECRAAAASISGDIHIERVRLETRMTVAGNDYSGDAIAQLAEAFMAGLDDPAVRSRLLDDFRAVASQIPRLPGYDPPPLPQTLEDLLALAPEAWHAVAHALAGGDAA